MKKSRRPSENMGLISGILAVSLTLLWLLWPFVVKWLYALSGGGESNATNLGLFGDSYGGLTSLFTLVALGFSILTNFLQYRQFQSLYMIEKFEQSRRFNDKFNDDDEIVNTIYELSNSGIRLDIVKDRGNNVVSAVFRSNSHNTKPGASRRSHKVLSLFEEYLICKNNDALDLELTSTIENRLEKFIVLGPVREYLRALDVENRILYINLRRYAKLRG